MLFHTAEEKVNEVPAENALELSSLSFHITHFKRKRDCTERDLFVSQIVLRCCTSGFRCEGKTEPQKSTRNVSTQTHDDRHSVTQKNPRNELQPWFQLTRAQKMRKHLARHLCALKLRLCPWSCRKVPGKVWKCK